MTMFYTKNKWKVGSIKTINFLIGDCGAVHLANHFYRQKTLTCVDCCSDMLVFRILRNLLAERLKYNQEHIIHTIDSSSLKYMCFFLIQYLKSFHITYITKKWLTSDFLGLEVLTADIFVYIRNEVCAHAHWYFSLCIFRIFSGRLF